MEHTRKKYELESAGEPRWISERSFEEHTLSLVGNALRKQGNSHTTGAAYRAASEADRTIRPRTHGEESIEAGEVKK